MFKAYWNYHPLCECDCHCNPYGMTPCQPIIDDIASCCQKAKEEENSEAILERIKESPLDKLLGKKEIEDEEITK